MLLYDEYTTVRWAYPLQPIDNNVSEECKRRGKTMTETFRAASVALHVQHHKTLNLAKMEQFISQAASDGVRLIVFPEGSLQGYIFHLDHHLDPKELEYLWQNAEEIPGPTTQLVSQWAAEHNMYIVFGMWEIAHHPATPVLHNTSVLIGPEGLIGKYHKVHQPIEELHHYQPGDDWPVFETPLATMGMMICFDQCFPEAARELTLRGAELLIVPNAWSAAHQASNDRYDFFGRARAAENNRWLIQSNQVGPSDRGTHSYLGSSRIIDPFGTVVACTAPNEEGLAITEVSPSKVTPSNPRAGWYLQQRVPSTYKSVHKPLPHREE